MTIWGKKDDMPPDRGNEGEKPMSSPMPKPAPAPVANPAPVSSIAETPGKVNALLGKGSEFEGKLSFEGIVRIDGIMKGEINSKDKLIIGEGARVEAEITVGSAMVSGEVTGNINASSEVELLAPAKMRGNIKTPSLIIQKGVIFEGNCSMATSSK